MKPKEQLQELEKTAEDLHEEYGVDRRELGKILVIASTTLLIVSIHATLTLQSVSKDLEQVNRQFDRAEAIIGSSNFQSALEDISKIKGSTLANSAEQAVESFNSAAESMDRVEEAETQVEHKSEIYKWLVLIGILGNVAGIVTLYL
ncbi:MAG: hypothetical protein ABEI58_04130 [Candidatus Nanohaloarchaea archaeon]